MYSDFSVIQNPGPTPKQNVPDIKNFNFEGMSTSNMDNINFLDVSEDNKLSPLLNNFEAIRYTPPPKSSKPVYDDTYVGFG